MVRGRASSASSFTGASTPCPPSATSGIRATCTSSGHEGVRASRRHLRPAVEVRLQGLHPDVQGREVRRRGAGPRSSKAAGERYVVPVAEHHDGFPMYDCTFTRLERGQDGPEARHGRRAGRGRARRGPASSALSSHRAEHWWFFDGGMKFDSDVKDPRFAGALRPGRRPRSARTTGGDASPTRHILDDWLARTAELVDKYQPQLVWFDWWIEQPAVHPYLQTLRRLLLQPRRRSGARAWPSTTRSTRVVPRQPRGCSTSSAASSTTIRPIFWQTDTSVCKNSWGYIEPRVQDRRLRSLVDHLVDIVSKNGACC